MAIERIKAELCTGCGICVNSCPMDVIRLDKEIKVAIIMYPEDCICCSFCVPDCPSKAVTVTLEKALPPLVSW